jgi:Family of unknown function (DUF6178)
VRVAIGMTHNYLNLGLEHLAGGDLRAAIEHLRNTHLQLLFRLGVSLTIDLRTRAENVMRTFGLTPGPAREIPYLDSPYREGIGAILERQPRYYGGLDRDGAVETRDFRAMRDLHLGYAMLEQVAAIPDLFKALLKLDIAAIGFRSQIAGYDIRLSQILLTAFARALIDGRLVIQPLDAAELEQARIAMMTPGPRPARLSDRFRQRVNETLAGLDEELRKRSADFINSCLNMIEEDLAELDPVEPIDPRFIRSLLIRK